MAILGWIFLGLIIFYLLVWMFLCSMVLIFAPYNLRDFGFTVDNVPEWYYNR